MSLDKSIEHEKEKRKKYYGSKAIDCTCRNHGSCPWCSDSRQHKNRKRKAQSGYDCDRCNDTGCICGGIGLTCDGCCDCFYRR